MSDSIIVSVVALRKVEEYKNNALQVMEDVQKAPEVPVTVELVPEPQNPYDHKAVAVVISKKQVGYLPRAEQGAIEERCPHVFTKGGTAEIRRWGVTQDGPYIELKIGQPMS